ncbi:MAG TPA: hypothetical protein VI111_11300 [Thermoleophilaceae bacterium]
MGVSIEYRLAGQQVDRDQFFRDVEEQVGRVAIEHLRARLERVRCLRHGRHARLAQVRVTGEEIEVRIAGCCEGLVDCVVRELG